MKRMKRYQKNIYTKSHSYMYLNTKSKKNESSPKTNALVTLIFYKTKKEIGL